MPHTPGPWEAQRGDPLDCQWEDDGRDDTRFDSGRGAFAHNTGETHED